MIKELFKGSAIYGIAPFVPKIFSVILLPILTKYLTSVDYGILATITSITFSIHAFSDLGLSVLLPNYFYKCTCQYKIVWREIYGFLSFWMIVFALLQALLLYVFIPNEAENNRWLIIILSNFSTVFFGPTAMIGQTYYQLSIKPTPVAVRVVVSGLISLITNFVCVVVFRWGYMGAFVASFAGTFFVNLSYWPVVNRKLGLTPIFNFKHRTILKMLKVGLPTIPHYYSVYLMNSSNILAMNYYHRPQSEIGKLGMAQNISTVFESFINAVNQVFGPMTYKFIRENNISEMKRILLVYIIFAYSLTSLYSLWSRELYGLLISNQEIAETYKYSIILVMAFNYRPIYVYCVNYFFYYEHTLQLLGITFLAGLISCIFYFSMTPYLGVYAALIGFYIGCLYMGYSGFFYSSYKNYTIYRVNWFFMLIIQIGLTILLYNIVDLSILSKLFVSLCYVIFVVFLFITKIRIRRVEE